jgi:hypothetical protein
MSNYITKTALKRRWSNSLVSEFAPQCIKKANPHGDAEMCLYAIADIERTEQMPEFKQELKRINKQRASQLMPTPESYALF